MVFPSRRQVLQMAGAAGVLGGLGLASTATQAAASTTARPGSYFVPSDQRLHLLRRATYGPTQSSYDEIKRRGLEGWLEQQLNPEAIDDSTCQSMVRDKFEWMSWSIAEVISKVSKGETWPFMTELSMAT